jgi:hypothetical protein
MEENGSVRHASGYNASLTNVKSSEKYEWIPWDSHTFYPDPIRMYSNFTKRTELPSESLVVME